MHSVLPLKLGVTGALADEATDPDHQVEVGGDEGGNEGQSTEDDD
jgi:hypothetical protein